MGEEELEAAQNKKLQERIAEIQQAQQVEHQKRNLLKYLLTPSAYERMMNVYHANKNLYNQVVSTLAYLAQNKRLSGKITEEQVVSLLTQLTTKKETKIEIKRKGFGNE
ncbi:hypothetical protein HY570_02015 [Candidatus Micrarchaeota archaeon]|nr:hypothetical protein [Candidatus Micrarchaeota archaeon]